MFVVELKVGESVKIGDSKVTLEEKTGRTARLVIDADKSIPIERVKQPTGAAEFAKNGLSTAM